MMNLPLNFEHLTTQSDYRELYAHLINQLNKDFLLANIDVSFDISLAPEQLKRNLRETVYHLIHDNFAQYLNLLYVMDVSEAKIKQLDGSDILKLSEEVTVLILQRELQKVYYKRNF
jgi:hypothetical protein